MTDRSELASSRRRIRRVYVLTLLFAFSLFLFHTILLFDIAAVMVHAEIWLTGLLGKHRYGKAIILGCFFFLFAGHLMEAAAWGLFLRWQRLVPTVSDGLYFAAVTITTLGYGDVVLPRPWRHIGPLIAIAGLLKFGCSTALLFVLIQAVWIRNL